ncbi:amino acid adenylation domain-containing protein, partial [Actinoplanes missouriensis]|uniref:amino acid adenylation domain-containing protein n=1 Tax=Actinoplanes missouriensis TaxID=1866 RepID=UPI00340A0FC8
GEELESVLATVTHAFVSPSVLGSLPAGAADRLPELRSLMVGAEACPPALVTTWAVSGRRVVNAYGPTEITVAASISDILTPGVDPVPIGRPVPGARLYVLDEWLGLVPPGVPGELYVAGSGVARGYAGRGGLTASRFVADPYAADGGRMYRTGDVVRWGTGGLEYLGRADDQVKIRGIRVEPGEVQAVLAAQPHVAQAVVIARGDGEQARLIGYVVAEEPSVVPAVLRDRLRAQLPAHLVPSAIVVLEAIPLNHAGKVDRSALPEPAYDGVHGRAPRTPQEEILCSLYAAVLGIPAVSIDESFFDLGGHSLLATRLISRIRAVLNVDVPLRALFDAPTVAELVRHLETGGAGRRALTVQPRPEVLPLSFAQQRLWFLYRFEGASATYNMPLVLRLTGDLDLAALEAAINDVIGRHEPLRTIFPDTGGDPHQRVLAASEARVDLRVEAVTEEELPVRAEMVVRHPFELDRAMPVHVEVLTLGPDDAVLLFVLHHIAADGWSLGPLTADLMTAYAARRAGIAPEWAGLPVQYADYTLWQHEVLGDHRDPDSVLGRQYDYWAGQLAGLPEQVTVPFDRPRPAVASYAGSVAPFTVDAETHAALRELASSTDTTMFMVLQAGMAALLTRLGAGEDIAVGSPIAGRHEEALDDLVGFFVNTLVFRTSTAGDPSFRELLDRVRETCLAAYTNQDIPFEYLVEKLNPHRSTAHHPLFQVVLVLQSIGDLTVDLPRLNVRTEPVGTGSAKFDIFVSVSETFHEDGTPAGISGLVEYATDLYDHATVEDFVARWSRLLRGAVAAPQTPLRALEILSAEERARLMRWSDADLTGAVPRRTTLPALFAEAVAARPQAPAVLWDGGELSYAELDAWSNRIGHHLIRDGVGPENRVALVMHRGPGLVATILGVVKAGAAYVPVDPDYPAERIDYMLGDAAPAAVLTDDFLATDLSGVPETRPEVVVRTQNPAYVIYTSGSTGRPKGVAVTHAGFANLANAQLGGFLTTPESRVLQFASPSFDVSVWELVMAFSAGAALVAASGEALAGDALADTLRRWRVSHVTLPPSVVATLDGQIERLDTLSMLIVAGEACPPDLAHRWAPGRRMINAYGPTEATVGAAMSLPLTGREQEVVPIGHPLAGLSTFVLDAGLQPVPRGVLGELYLSGAGLARGYLGRPGLTAERFVACPYGEPGSRMYRTGDVVRWNADGHLEFLGRADDQVKIRGFRVEPGEIQAEIQQQPDVEQAAVLAQRHREDDVRLVAYVVPRTAGFSVEGLRDVLRDRLPGYMVPSAFVVLPEMPLTPNGKVDRKALPAAQWSSEPGRTPRTPQEEVLCSLYAEVLGVPEVGVDDGFFDLGGHSLLAARLSSRVRAVLGVELPLRLLFEAPTVGELVRRLGAGDDGGEGAFGVLLPLRTGGGEPPLFCVHSGGGMSWNYASLLPYLGADFPVYGLQARGLRDEVPAASIEEVADDCIAAMRQVQPHGPYRLIGHSFGGIVAHAMAARLEDQGESASLVICLDAKPAAQEEGLEERPDADYYRGILELLGVDADQLPDGPLAFADFAAFARGTNTVLGSIEEDEFRTIMRVMNNNIAITGDYRHRRIRTRMVLFAATEGTDAVVGPEIWRDLVDGPIDYHRMPATHAGMLKPETLAVIGPVIEELLRGN